MTDLLGSYRLTQDQDFSFALIALLKGIVYREDTPDVWRAIIKYQAAIHDYVSAIGLIPVTDEAEGYAFLNYPQSIDGEESKLPRLVARRQLTYPVSLLLALLRKRLAEFDSGGSDSRLIMSRDEIVEMIRIFLPVGSNEAKLIDQVDATLNKVTELGFVRRLKGQANLVEVRRIIKAFVDAQWLSDFHERLEEYQRLSNGITGGVENE